MSVSTCFSRLLYTNILLNSSLTLCSDPGRLKDPQCLFRMLARNIFQYPRSTQAHKRIRPPVSHYDLANVLSVKKRVTIFLRHLELTIDDRVSIRGHIEGAIGY